MRYSVILFLLASLFTSNSCFAKGERYGVSVQMLSLKSQIIDDRSTGADDVLRFGLVHTRPIDENNARWRWWLGVNYISSDVKAPANGFYHEVDNIEFRIVPQYAFSAYDWLTPYIGAGISVGYSSYSDRWYVDSEGYKYDEQLEDESAFEFGAVLNVGTAIKLGKNPNAHIQLIPQVSYVPPLNDGLGGIELTFAVLF